jgi:diguanylate cyclase (GGDEF)-like protein
MLHVDILSGYLICGVGSLIAAAVLRLAQTDDPLHRQALRTCGWCFVVLGVSLLPAGMGREVAAHPAVQWTMTAGSLLALAILARGLGLLQARGLDLRWVAAFATIGALLCAVLLAVDRKLFGHVYSVLLFSVTVLILWNARGFVLSPRDASERLLGLTLALLCASMALRAYFTVTDTGPARVDIMYGPAALASAFAAFYGVTPMIVATFLLNLINARLQQQLHSRAQTDELTGALTRRALRELAPALIARTQRVERELAVMMLDIDHFKAINDTHGHASGDEVLRVVATTLQAQKRADGLLARYGGEEFVALLPVDGLPTARRIAERMRSAIADTDWGRAAQLPTGVTVSIGVSIVGAGEPLEAALGRADEALYRAKRGGRNQCQVGLMAAA